MTPLKDYNKSTEISSSSRVFLRLPLKRQKCLMSDLFLSIEKKKKKSKTFQNIKLSSKIEKCQKNQKDK